jgi:hypothetical protein
MTNVDVNHKDLYRLQKEISMYTVCSEKFMEKTNLHGKRFKYICMHCIQYMC